MVTEDRCVCCGSIIPEGRMYCIACQSKCESNHANKKHKDVSLKLLKILNERDNKKRKMK